MIYDLIIIGGGSSGVFAALRYKELHPNKKFLIIESNKTLLRKLSVSGNGKCNFTNECLDYNIYNNGDNFKFIFNNNPLDTILSFFNKYNIKYYIDEEGRYYPYSNSAKSIQNILINSLDKDEYLLDIKVIDIKKYNNFIIKTNLDKTYEAKNILVSIGNKNYKTLGSDGSLFNKIKELGHTFTDIYPSNIYIKVQEKNITNLLNGLRFKSRLYLYNDDKLLMTKGYLLNYQHLLMLKHTFY